MLRTYLHSSFKAASMCAIFTKKNLFYTLFISVFHFAFWFMPTIYSTLSYSLFSVACNFFYVFTLSVSNIVLFPPISHFNNSLAESKLSFAVTSLVLSYSCKRFDIIYYIDNGPHSWRHYMQYNGLKFLTSTVPVMFPC